MVPRCWHVIINYNNEYKILVSDVHFISIIELNALLYEAVIQCGNSRTAWNHVKYFEGENYNQGKKKKKKSCFFASAEGVKSI